MYKLELKFDTSQMNQEMIEEICKQTDQIFAQVNLNCDEKKPGERVYSDCGRRQDYGRFWAAIFALKDASWLTEYLKECFWYNGNQKENLMTDFIRN